MFQLKSALVALLAVTIIPPSYSQGVNVLPFITLNTTVGVVTESVGHFDDGVSHVINIPTGFPFGNRIHNLVYIGTNGYYSFSEPFYSAFPEPFPGFSNDVLNAYLVAPYWDDIDIRRVGNIFYEIHSAGVSDSLLAQVSNFVSTERNETFSGSWMMIAHWDNVQSWPSGEDQDFRDFLASIGIDSSTNNTFQAILITDGSQSYTVLTYKCGEMQWTYNGATIGYNAAGAYSENHPNTGSFSSHEIACLNGDQSVWYNVVYKLSRTVSNVTLAPPPTVEPPQGSYLQYLYFGSNVLPRCRNCSSVAIPLGDPGIPFGSYYHTTAYVGTNGIISFGVPFTLNNPATFPTQQASSYYTYIIAPHWSDVDTRLDGAVRYSTYTSNNVSDAQQISMVENFINGENRSLVNANWMLVATWDNVHPFPHGNSAEQDRQDPYLQSTNRFQAIVISNGTKTFSVFVFNCDDMGWSDAATIGFNAGGTLFANHPLTGQPESRVIGCVHTPESNWNNVIFDLSPVEASGTTPAPLSSIGSCAAAGITECCDASLSTCFGEPSDCFCDQFCVNFGDCCHDQPSICQTGSLNSGNDSYLLYTDHFYIGRLSLDGSVFETLPLPTLAGASALDFDYRRGYIYWSDYILNVIFRADLNGSNMITLFNTSLNGFVEDIAVDWVSNKLYLTETLHRRIDVFDLETLIMAPLLDADANSGVRAIAVDPSTRYMYWTDWGEPAKIERASMDGTNRRVLHNTGLNEPSGITVDYESQTVYWTDSLLGVIEYSNVDGTNRRRLQSGLFYPYGITIEGSIVIWTDWIDVGIHFTHKIDGENVTTIENSFSLQPVAVQAITPERQANSTNYCEGSLCSHVCVLSSTISKGYSCVCPDGYTLSNETDCVYVGTLPPPVEGTCGAGGYNDCCAGGYCAGSPPTCFCDSMCRNRGDCCSDIDTTCVVSTTSSCSAAGYDTCCTDFSAGCVGVAQTSVCYCDIGCHNFGDCCDDIDSTCPLATQPPATTPTGVTGVTTTSSPTPPSDSSILEFLTLNSTSGVITESVGHFDDGVSHAIHVPQGFPFGNLQHTFVFISTNGIISFGEPFYVLPPVLFPSVESTVAGSYLVAPFWSDVDITQNGNIYYEVHTSDSESADSIDTISTISEFVSNKTGSNFSGTWMMVASWEDVHPWPNGIADSAPIFQLIFPDYQDSNTYQAIVITDGTDSYSVFTYKCGELEWARGATIGYNAGGDTFQNHPLSGEIGTPSIACSNSGTSSWVNVVYKLSVDNPTGTPIPPTVEPPQTSYLPMLDFTGQDSLGTLPPCQNCTASVSVTIPDFPFGSFYHNSIYVGTNGIISFDSEFRKDVPEPFPSESDVTVFSAYLVAPYWSNIDTRLNGSVWYEIFNSGEGSATSDGRLNLVTNFINSEADSSFVDASWMMVATWDKVHPNPHGESAEQDREDPYLQSTNTFQAVLISNGTKSYAIFTYVCDNMEWSDEATIGFNAAGSLYQLHPLSGRIHASAIDCVHSHSGSKINNVVFDLAPEVPQGTIPPPVERIEIPFILGTTVGVTSTPLARFDDGASDPIPVTTQNGFPFGNSFQTQAYVGTNGVISFGSPFTLHVPVLFPSFFPEVYTNYILAPFWSDVDISLIGDIYYEVHTTALPGSAMLLDRVSKFVSNRTGESFNGTWMLVALWDEVHPFLGFFPGTESNKFQAIAITNGSESYAVYTYKCGEMEWSNGAVIGYNGGSQTDYFANHSLSGSDDAQTISCLEFPGSEWTNVLYKLSIDNVVTTAPPSTVEPPQSAYLPFLEKTGNNQEVLGACDDCHSNEINLSEEPVPFGNYRHTVAFVSSNGIISFGEEFTFHTSVIFPSSNAGIHYAYVLAPYWADIDIRSRGEVWLETHTRNEFNTSDQLLDQVSNFVNNQTNASGFVGTWMLVATWNGVPPYTGEGAFFSTPLNNTFQAVVITNGTKSYAIYTYMCDQLQWSNEATIGYNAASDYFINHPLSGTALTNDIDCVHQPGSVWNNVVYDLVPGELREGTTPPPVTSFGSCLAAGFTECCEGFNCFGSSPGDCFCDDGCYQFDDCCHDIDQICTTSPNALNATLVVATQYTLTLLNGSSVENLLVNDFNALYLAVDYDYRRGYLYYSDNVKNTIMRSNFDGSNRQVIVDSNIESVDGLAVDWVNNKLYWTDAIYTRIEVIDLDGFERKLLFIAGPHTAPRAIVVDPTTRYMYWTDWGEPAKIERASMDGTNREVIHNTGLVWPNGLTIDYHDQRIYWADASLDRIEYSNVDGSGRVVLETEENGLVHPFGITLHNDIIYWTDWDSQSIFMTHKLLGQTILPVYENLAFVPSGIEAISSDRQADVTNPCDGNSCAHLCLLSSAAEAGYSCSCPDGETLLANGRDCSNTSTPTPPVPPRGLCAAAGYTSCCSGGLCYGSPPTCFCEQACLIFNDCCEDFVDICFPTNETTTMTPTTMVTTTMVTTTSPPCDAVPPNPIANLILTPLSASSLTITWTPSSSQFCGNGTFIITIQTFSGVALPVLTLGDDIVTVTINENLERWVPYNISVVAMNDYGTSSPVVGVTFTEEGAPPVPPSNVEVKRTSDTEMSVSWDPLTPTQARGFVTSYTVTYTEVLSVLGRRKRADDEKSEEVPPEMSQVTIGNLNKDASYTVSVRANTKAGSGTNSELITTTSIDVTTAPRLGVDGGAVAGGLIFAVIVVICVLAIVVVLIVVLRRRRKITISGEYAEFNNDGTLSRTPSLSQPTERQQPSLTFDGPGSVVTMGYKELEAEGAPAFENPTYGIAGNNLPEDNEEPRYEEVKKLPSEMPPGYDTVTSNAPRPDDPGYEVMKGDLSVNGEEEKQDLSFQGAVVSNEVPKEVALNEYQRMDEV